MSLDILKGFLNKYPFSLQIKYQRMNDANYAVYNYKNSSLFNCEDSTEIRNLHIRLEV